MTKKAKVKKYGAGVICGLVLVVQLIPYGRDHANPPLRREPAWDRPETRELARRACFNCHSNQTSWPWYASVAPVSWLTQSDVDEGRQKLNFSEWDRPQPNAAKAPEEVRSGDMPPWYYLPAHRDAKLSAAERDALIAGLRATVGAPPTGAR
jgi:mono/diheme cytochrome c family protein